MKRQFSMGTTGMIALAYIVAVVTFVGGSAAFDWLAILRPSETDVVAAMQSQMARQISNFRVASLRYAEVKDDSKARYADVSLVFNTSLYGSVDFATFATTRGDNPQGYADALLRRNLLPPAHAPPIPKFDNRITLYTEQKRAGSEIGAQVSFFATKQPRRWALRDCYAVFLGFRNWQFSDIGWSAPPRDIGSLRPRDELTGATAVAGEPAGEALIRDYVDRRRAFIQAVADKEHFLLETAAYEAIRDDILRTFVPNAYSLKKVSVGRPVAQPSSADRTWQTEASVVIEQTAELFRESSEGISANPKFEEHRKTATDFLLAVAPLPITAPIYYASVSPTGTRFTGRVQFEVSGSPAQPIVEKVTWLERPAIPASVIRADEAKPNAVFCTEVAGVYSLKAYSVDVEAYVSRVDEATAALANSWGPDREAWRLVTRAVAALGGRKAIFGSFTDDVAGTKMFSDGRKLQFTGKRHVALPFRWREEFSCTNENSKFQTSDVLDRTGCWFLVNNVMRMADLYDVGVAEKRRLATYADNVLWHLINDKETTFMLARIPETNPSKVTVKATGFPDVTLTFDAEAGYLISVAFSDTANPPHSIEFTYSDFKPSPDIIRPGRVQRRSNGNITDDYVTRSSSATSSDLTYFRNPYSSGKPFRGGAYGRTHKLKISNSILLGSALVCIDDDPATITLSATSNRTISLPEGDHELVIVGWLPQLNIKLSFTQSQVQTQKIEAKPLRLSVNRDQELVIDATKTVGGSLICRVR